MRRRRVFGFLTRLGCTIFDDRHGGQHHDRCTADIGIGTVDVDDDITVDAVDDKCPQSRRLQPHASSQ